ncbi:hypothetical protein THIOKS1470012 [Thiocapsa sp. KS1]|nr:hypothetical protein [Thiocapsa sp. KS1]CRI67217.1 hypothetical protein THIOKS1470012 [Thiocapsa sp. KS1]
MGKVACAVRAICGSAEMLADSMLMINLMVEYFAGLSRETVLCFVSGCASMSFAVALWRCCPTGGHKGKTCEALVISRPALDRKIERYALRMA